MLGIQLKTPIVRYGVSFGFATPAEGTAVGSDADGNLRQMVRMALWANSAAYTAYVQGGGMGDIGSLRGVAPVVDVPLPSSYLAVAYGAQVPANPPAGPTTVPTSILGWLMWLVTTAPATAQIFAGTIVSV